MAARRGRARPQRPLAFPRRGEVYLVSLDPTVGAEIRKTRPAVVIQNDIANEVSPTTIVAAITSKIRYEDDPATVMVEGREGGLHHRSVILLGQVRTVDRKRLIHRMGVLKSETMARVDRALAVSLGLFG
jgi:mRNA interferase MazF